MDGLMFNTERLYYRAGDRLLARRGKAMSPELANAMMGLRSAEALEVMRRWHGLTDAIEALANETRELYLALMEEHLEPMPGLMTLLDLLERRRIPRAVATSSRRLYVDKALGQWDLRGRFAFVLSAEDVTHGKPHPEIYLAAAERFDIAPREMLVLEDSQAGLRSAKAAGALCVIIPHEHNVGQDFSQADACLAALDAPQLLQWFDGEDGRGVTRDK
ncbi:MAG: HAD family phosphatase [Planctomycetes bacterium]|nr:HAD family phosphatase [Planctomycetota bacterium]